MSKAVIALAILILIAALACYRRDKGKTGKPWNWEGWL